MLAAGIVLQQEVMLLWELCCCNTAPTVGIRMRLAYAAGCRGYGVTV